MTSADAACLAARTLTAIDAMAETRNAPADFMHRAADRERVASDLARIMRHQHSPDMRWCRSHGTLDYVGPCADHRDADDGLRRTAALYGVQP